jgi:hypothetical protein
MKHNKDFIYEYSDLNLFQTRAQILTGQYKNIIVEFGTSGVMTGIGYPIFNFDYTIYQAPNDFEPDNKFEEYLCNLLIEIIDHRNNDKESKIKLDEAASEYGTQSSIIKIAKEFYPERWGVHEPIVFNMESF